MSLKSKRLLSSWIPALGVAVAVVIATPNPYAQAQSPHVTMAGGDCAALQRANLTGMRDGATTIASSDLVAAAKGLPEYCRVKGVIGPGHINFEVRMPSTSWNGRMLAQGSGGSGGSVNIESCNDVLAGDFAVVATDLGHAASDDFWTKDFQQLIDFSFRATHLTTVAAKELIRAYYGRPQTFAYFRGCSSGGRAAMANAQRFPGDFDGIIAGDVGNPRAGAYFLPAWIMQSNVGKDGSSVLTQADLPKINRAVLAACVQPPSKEHGFLDNPLECRFDPKSIICKTSNVTADCITAAQAEFVQKVYDGPRDSKGRPIFLGGVRVFGLVRGSELQWANWMARTSDPASAPDYTSRQEWFQEQAFFQTPIDRHLKIMDVDFDRDPDRVNAMESLWNASNPDLRALETKGVKILSYSGWSDNRVQPEGMIDYYKAAAAISGGAQKTAEFYRLFLVPGMGHCGGGPGADTIDWLSAIVDWVEHNKAPEVLQGSHVVKGKAEFSYPTPRFKIEK